MVESKDFLFVDYEEDENDEFSVKNFSDFFDDFEEYFDYHNAIDNFAWLLKLRYSSKEIIKSKKYRLDILLQEYIKENNISIDRISKKIISKKKCYNQEKFEYFMKQGWYNELAATFPFTNSMSISSQLDFLDYEKEIFLFPSWYIVKSYYTIYSFYNSLIFTNYENFNTTQHRNSTKNFNNTLLEKFSKDLIFYPFSITNLNFREKELFKANKDFWGFQYSQSPRKHLSIYQIAKNYNVDLKLFESKLQKSKSKEIFPINIIDILYQFRVWGNYLESDTVIKMQYKGYLYFLEKNIMTIIFFVAFFSEITALSLLGEKRFFEIFKNFYDSFICKKEVIFNNWYSLNLINRLRIYEHLNLISSLPNWIAPPKLDKLELIK